MSYDPLSYREYELERNSIHRTYANGHNYAEWVHYKICHEGGGCHRWNCPCCKGPTNVPTRSSEIAELLKRVEDGRELLKRGKISAEKAFAMVAMQAIRVISDRTGTSTWDLMGQNQK